VCRWVLKHIRIVDINSGSSNRHRRGVSRGARRGQLPFLAGTTGSACGSRILVDSGGLCCARIGVFEVKVAVCILDQIVAIAEQIELPKVVIGAVVGVLKHLCTGSRRSVADSEYLMSK